MASEPEIIVYNRELAADGGRRGRTWPHVLLSLRGVLSEGPLPSAPGAKALLGVGPRPAETAAGAVVARTGGKRWRMTASRGLPLPTSCRERGGPWLAHSTARTST